jgi:formyl-CoA transferase
MGWVQPLQLPNGVQTKTFGSPIRLSGQAMPVRRRPPALGEHNEEILSFLPEAN